MKKLIFAVALSIMSHASIAQNLVITLNDSSTEIFALNDILSMKFGTASLIVYQTDGTVNSWDIAVIDNYAFDATTDVNNTSGVTVDELAVFPNPTNNELTINYSSNQVGKINIDLYDNNGRIVETIFSGTHENETNVNWNKNQNSAIRSGKYIIKISTPTKVITKPIIIQ